MAEKRMFAKTIIDSDNFIDMPISARLLYYDLGMRADDDGFVNAPKKITRMIGASQDDLKILIQKGFIIPFDSGIIVITHWRINNYIPKDRYHETTFQNELQMLTMNDNREYSPNSVYKVDTDCIQDEYSSDTQIRVEKNSIEKNSIEEIREEAGKPPRAPAFKPPTVEEVAAYCQERQNGIDPEAFVTFYEGTNWFRGKTKIKDWKACVRTWEKRDRETPPREKPQPKPKQYTTAAQYEATKPKTIDTDKLDAVRAAFGL